MEIPAGTVAETIEPRCLLGASLSASPMGVELPVEQELRSPELMPTITAISGNLRAISIVSRNNTDKNEMKERGRGRQTERDGEEEGSALPCLLLETIGHGLEEEEIDDNQQHQHNDQHPCSTHPNTKAQKELNHIPYRT